MRDLLEWTQEKLYKSTPINRLSRQNGLWMCAKISLVCSKKISTVYSVLTTTLVVMTKILILKIPKFVK